MQQIHEGKPLYVGVDTVAYDFGVSRAKAYAIIKDLNMELKKCAKILGDGRSKTQMGSKIAK